MEEAERFEWLVAMDAGAVLAHGTAAEIQGATGARRWKQAYIALLPEADAAATGLTIPPLRSG